MHGLVGSSIAKIVSRPGRIPPDSSEGGGGRRKEEEEEEEEEERRKNDKCVNDFLEEATYLEH